jgi:hypothetical protein
MPLVRTALGVCLALVSGTRRDRGFLYAARAEASPRVSEFERVSPSAARGSFRAAAKGKRVTRNFAETVRRQEPVAQPIRQAPAFSNPIRNSRKGVPARTSRSAPNSSSSWAVINYSACTWRRRGSIGLPTPSLSRFSALSRTFSAILEGSVASRRQRNVGCLITSLSWQDCWQVFVITSFKVNSSAIPCSPSPPFMGETSRHTLVQHPGVQNAVCRPSGTITRE